MDQTEEQEEYNQQKNEGNESLENKVQNLTEKFHGMDEKLNALANLMADIAAQAREGKHKYQSGSSILEERKRPELVLTGKMFLSHHLAEIMTRQQR